MIVLGLKVTLDQLLDDLAALAGGIRAVKAVERVLLDGNGRAVAALVNCCVVRGSSGAIVARAEKLFGAKIRAEVDAA